MSLFSSLPFPAGLFKPIHNRSQNFAFLLLQICPLTLIEEIEQINPPAHFKVKIEIPIPAALAFRSLRRGDSRFPHTAEAFDQISALRISHQLVLNRIKQVHLLLAT